jgi:two-component system, OmpR family, phosphate regulon response regulator OmpR
MSDRVLAIEDDTRLVQMLTEYLGEAGFSLAHATSGEAGLAQFDRESFAAVILDVMLPDIDGFEVCRRLRQRSDVPVLMLTARGDPTDRIVGLELGADDYLPKPFNARELLARLRAIMRRHGSGVMTRSAPGAIQRFGRLEIDRDARAARLDGKVCELTSYQFAIVAVLAESAGRVLSREQIVDKLKGQTFDAFDRSIDVHISRIRGVIEDDPKKPRRIITVRGAGYVFAKIQDT